MLRNLLLQLAWSNAWLSLSASAQAWLTCLMLDREATAEALVLPFLSIFLVYTFAKTVRFDPQADAVNDPGRTQFLLRWRTPLITAAVVGWVVGLADSFRHGADVAALFAFPIGVAVLYDVKFLPSGWRYRRLKDITGVKSLVVAVTWAVTGVLLPGRLTGADFGPAVALLLAWNGLMFFINTVYFDLGDVKGDRLEGTVTLPIALGFARTRRLLGLVNGVCALLLAVGAALGWLAPVAWFVNLLSLYNWFYLQAARDEDTDLGFLCDVVVDGLFLAGAAFAAVGLVVLSQG